MVARVTAMEMHPGRRKGHGDARCAPARQGWAGAAATGVKVMEMQVGRRPVYGGAPRNRPRKDYGDPPCTPAANVKTMEPHLVRRPVYGGPARQGLTGMAAQRNLAGGPGVLRTPGRRPPHRNGGARRLSGYAAKSRSDAPTGGAQASPFLCFRPPLRRPMQKGWGFALPPHSHERTTIIREIGKKMAAELKPVTKQQGHAR